MLCTSFEVLMHSHANIGKPLTNAWKKTCKLQLSPAEQKLSAVVHTDGICYGSETSLGIRIEVFALLVRILAMLDWRFKHSSMSLVGLVNIYIQPDLVNLESTLPHIIIKDMTSIYQIFFGLSCLSWKCIYLNNITTKLWQTTGKNFKPLYNFTSLLFYFELNQLLFMHNVNVLPRLPTRQSRTKPAIHSSFVLGSLADITNKYKKIHLTKGHVITFLLNLHVQYFVLH